MIHGIHHVAIHVRDFDRMVQFYNDAFGFEMVGEETRWKDNPVLDSVIGLKNSAARMAILRAGNTYVELFEFSSPKSREAEPLLPSDRGYTHFCVDVSDIESEYKRLTALGMRFMHTAPVDFGIVKSAYGRDLEGNLIEIQEVARANSIELTDWKKANLR